MAAPDRANVELTLVTSLEGLSALEPHWRLLESAAGNTRPVFFQSFAWNRFVAERRREHDGDNFLSPLIAVWSRGGRPIGILPLAIVKAGGCRVAMTLDDPYGQFSCILVDAEENVEALVALLIARLRQDRLVDVLKISKVIPTSPLYAALGTFNMRQLVEHGTAVIDIREFDDAQSYRASLSKRARRAQRNSWNRLNLAGTPETRVIEDRTELADIIHRSIEQRYDWMKALGKTAPAFRDPAYVATLNALAEHAPSDVRLIGFEFALSGEPLALQWGFLHANRYYAYIASRSLEHDELSPGRLHLEAIVADCIGRGVEIVELMSPANQYKLQLGGEIVPITDFEMPLTWRGYALIEVWRRRIRPGIKSGYEALPTALRRRINEVFHRAPGPEERTVGEA